MSGTKTLLWALALVVLAAFYYVYEIQGGKRREQAARQEALLVQVEPEAVTGITLERASETITAVKRQEQWQLTAPLSAPGDDRKLTDLLRYVAELRFLRQVDDQPTTLEPFGLTEPTLELRLQRQASSEPVVIRLGTQNPTGRGYYAQVESDAAVYLIPSSAKNTLDASLYDLRDKTVLAFAPAEVQEIRLEAASDPPVTLRRQDHEHWQMTAPVDARGDPQQAGTLLQRLQQVQVQAFVAEAPSDLAPYGLQTPRLRVALTVEQDRTVKTLLLGTVDTDRKGIYAKRDDAANVVLLPQQFWDDLPKTATALRDKTLLDYAPERIARIEIVSPRESIRVERTGSHQFRLQQPIEAQGDPEAISSLLRELKALEALDFVAEAPETFEPFGLESPRLLLQLTAEAPGDRQEVPQSTLLIGDDAPEDKGTYVRLASRPTVYLVERAAAERLLATTAFDLRDKKLLAFDTAAVQKLQLRYPDATLTLERQGDAWSLTEPDTTKLSERWQVEALLYELSTLEYVRIMPEAAANDAQHGLETPQVRITVWPGDGAPLDPLVIGKPVATDGDASSLVYARVGSDPPVYALEARVLDALPRHPNDLTSAR